MKAAACNSTWGRRRYGAETQSAPAGTHEPGVRFGLSGTKSLRSRGKRTYTPNNRCKRGPSLDRQMAKCIVPQTSEYAWSVQARRAESCLYLTRLARQVLTKAPQVLNKTPCLLSSWLPVSHSSLREDSNHTDSRMRGAISLLSGDASSTRTR